MPRGSAIAVLVLALGITGCSQPEPPAPTSRVQAAIVQLRPLDGRTAHGVIDLEPTGGGLAVNGQLLGLRGEAYELRAHRLGNCTDLRGLSAGSEFAYTDPVTGSSIDGTIMEITNTETGEVAVSGRFRGGRLSGTLSLRGRSVLLHRIDRDENGARVAIRVACGVVGIAREGTGAD